MFVTKENNHKPFLYQVWRNTEWSTPGKVPRCPSVPWHDIVDPHQQGRHQGSSETGLHSLKPQGESRWMQETHLSLPGALWAQVRLHNLGSSYGSCTSVTKLLKDLQWDYHQERRQQQYLREILTDHVTAPVESIVLTYSSWPGRTNTTDLQKSCVHIPIPDWNYLSHAVAQFGTVDNLKCRLAVLPWGADPPLR